MGDCFVAVYANDTLRRYDSATQVARKYFIIIQRIGVHCVVKLMQCKYVLPVEIMF